MSRDRDRLPRSASSLFVDTARGDEIYGGHPQEGPFWRDYQAARKIRPPSDFQIPRAALRRIVTIRGVRPSNGAVHLVRKKVA